MWATTLRSNAGNVIKIMKSFSRHEIGFLRGAYNPAMSGASRAGVSAMTSGASNMGIRGAYAMGGLKGLHTGLGGGFAGAARMAGWGTAGAAGLYAGVGGTYGAIKGGIQGVIPGL
jgi:hypothetical protein